MARTPLMRALQQMAADHAEAERRGVDVHRIREERLTAGEPQRDRLTRREFLTGSAALGAAAMFGGRLLFPTRTRAASPRIAIVGGGIAGLTAALTLADKGLSSTVYESSTERVGGRMFTDHSGYWDAGQITEWGGELIDTGHKTVRFLAQRFRLKLVDLVRAEPNGSEPTYFFDGSYYPKAQADRDFQPVHRALSRDTWAASYPTTFEINTPEGVVLDNMSVYDWIDSRVPGGHGSPLGRLLDVAYDIEFGAPTTDQSSLNLIYLLGYNASPGNFALFGGSDERYHILAGNQSLPDAIRGALPPDAVQMGWRMTSIAQGGGAYAVDFETPLGPQTVTADHVILAFHFGVLRTLNYSGAGFDALKVQAIEELGLGHNGKLNVQFTDRLWNTDGPWPAISNGESYADTGYQNTWDVTRGQPEAPGILVNYTGGNVTDAIAAAGPYTRASESAQVITATQTFLGQLEPVYPGIGSRWNGRASLSLPHLDPNYNCSYSYWRVGQYHTIAGYEGVRQGNIHFAGEHTSVDFQGWMEGGAITGVRAANEVLADLK
ncbi:MAG: NAD(P)/FAD-dependent oxidoreductase [Chloroflexota bacterium]